MKKYLLFLLCVCITFICFGCNENEKSILPQKIDIIESSKYDLGAEKKFEVKITPEDCTDKRVEFYSSNEEVISIDEEGNAKFLALGVATLTVKSLANEEVYDSVKVEVTNPYITRIILDSEKYMKVGVSEKLEVILFPENSSGKLEWKSYDTSIAVVDENGVVTGLRPGGTTIECKSFVDPLVTAGCYITFNATGLPEDVLAPESINISCDKTKIDVGYKTDINVDFTPSYSDKDINWVISDESIATILDSGELMGLKAGEVEIYCYSKLNKNIKSNTIKINVREGYIQEVPTDLKGYKIEIMVPFTIENKIDPFNSEYSEPDKLYKQAAWMYFEKQFNCDISITTYPYSFFPFSRNDYIISNAEDKKALADLSYVTISDINYVLKESNDIFISINEYYNESRGDYIWDYFKDAYTINNNLMAIPSNVNTAYEFDGMGLFYNLKWVQDLNVTEPAKLFNEGKWNYTEFKNWCLTVQSYLNSENGEYAFGGHALNYLYGFAAAASVQLYDKETNTINFNSDKVKDISSLIYGLVQEGCINPEQTWEEAEGGFIEGKTVMAPGKIWFVDHESRWRSDLWGEETMYGYVPFPYPDYMSKEETSVYSTNLGAFSFNSHREWNYPEGVTFNDIYYVIDNLYIKTLSLQDSNPNYDEDLVLSERISKYLDSKESVEALKWFNEENIMYDLYYTYEMNSRYYVRNFAVETFINGKDFDTEYSKIESLLEDDLKYYLT